MHCTSMSNQGCGAGWFCSGAATAPGVWWDGVDEFRSGAVSCCYMGVERSKAVLERGSILLLRSLTAPLCSQLYSEGAARYYSAPKLLRCAPLRGSSKILLRSKTDSFCSTPLRSHSHRAAIYCSAPKMLRSKLLPLYIPGSDSVSKIEYTTLNPIKISSDFTVAVHWWF